MKMKNYARLKRALLYVWIIFLMINLICVLVAYRRNFIGDDSLTSALKQVSKCYLPYLGVILAYYWSVRNVKTKIGNINSTGISTALICSGIWNILILFFFISIPFGGDIEKAMKNVDLVSDSFSWLVAGAIGFYFGKEKEN